MDLNAGWPRQVEEITPTSSKLVRLQPLNQLQLVSTFPSISAFKGAPEMPHRRSRRFPLPQRRPCERRTRTSRRQRQKHRLKPKMDPENSTNNHVNNDTWTFKGVLNGDQV